MDRRGGAMGAAIDQVPFAVTLDGQQCGSHLVVRNFVRNFQILCAPVERRMNQPNPFNIPIIYCEACNKAPMIARTFNQHLREKNGIDIELECPRCGVRTIEKLALQHRRVNPDAASRTDE